jgi:hypothetical protein
MTRHLLSVCLLVLTVWSVAAKQSFTATWKTPDGAAVSFAGQKVVGLIVSPDMNLRMSAEEALARGLTAKGVQGLAAYRVIPAEEIRDKDRVKAWFERAGAAGVVIMRLVNLSVEEKPSKVRWESGAQYGALWDYYPYAWGASIDLTPARTNVTIVVETLVFDIAGNRMLWAGTSETTNPQEAQAFVADLVDAAADEMRKDGLIRAR